MQKSLNKSRKGNFIQRLQNAKEQLAKANCSVLQGGTRRKSNVIYSIDGILSFIQGVEGNESKSNV
ncbi:hypothetical protein EXW56_26905 (plasmid) [Bacillus mycoides]|nr:hypothetical protein EXW56_26905 [Bacillus mycoides]